MTFRRIARIAVLALATVTAMPMMASAFDDAQKQELGDFIKSYLIAHPEIMLDVQKALEEKQSQAKLEASTKAIADNRKDIFNSATDIALGNPKGDVTIVEFFDYNCGYCKHAISDMTSIIEKDKNVRFVLKELPILGPDSMAAHRVSDAFRKIAPEKYGEFHLALLGGDGRSNEKKALAVAAKLGVSEEAIRAKMKESPNDKSVKEVYELATALGINGTPSYVIGDEAVFGAVGEEMLSGKIANLRSCGKATC